MRVNIYAEEMTDRIEIIGKEIEGHTYTGLRLYLELPVTLPDGTQAAGPFLHRPGDDDSAAITFWGKRDLRAVLRKMLSALDEHYGDADALIAPANLVTEAGMRALKEAWPATQATMRLEAGAPPAACSTCNDQGIIGGPSYSQPDEGGEPCPDCAQHAAATVPSNIMRWNPFRGLGMNPHPQGLYVRYEDHVAALAAREPLFLKGVGKINGDGHKDTTRKGEVVFVYAQELPEPYSPGQYPRVGNVIWSASTEQYDFAPATLDEVRAFIEGPLEAAATTAYELGRVKRLAGDLGKIIHDMTVAEQAAWIEWQHGRGAEAAMSWIHNGLEGPGHIPDEDVPYGKEPQAWFDANRADPFPTCFCGRPSNRLWMGKGFCSNEHYQQHHAEAEAKKTEG